MALDLDYDRMVQKALLQVVRDALTLTAEKGLTGSHHFYLTFQTNRSDVQIPENLKEKYPEEMTIVLQHQFWDLSVSPVGFGVTLSFDDRQENLWVPFSAIVSFLDPSVKFGLQFESVEPPVESSTSTSTSSQHSSKDTSSKVVTLDAVRKK